MWAAGGAIGGGQDEEKDIKDFNSVWKATSKIKFPEQGLCYDYFWDIEEAKWVSWNTKVKPYI